MITTSVTIFLGPQKPLDFTSKGLNLQISYLHSHLSPVSCALIDGFPQTQSTTTQQKPCMKCWHVLACTCTVYMYSTNYMNYIHVCCECSNNCFYTRNHMIVVINTQDVMWSRLKCDAYTLNTYSQCITHYRCCFQCQLKKE